MPSLNPIAAAVEFLENDQARDLLGLHKLRVGGNLITRGELAEVLKKAQADGFVQPKTTGYRQLGAEEAALMNEIKAKGVELGALVEKLRACKKQHFPKSPDTEEFTMGFDVDQRWVSIGATDLQTGLMALTRAVAKPTTF